MRSASIKLFFGFLLRIGFRLEPGEEADGVRWLIKEPGSGNCDVFSQQTPRKDTFSVEALIDERGPVASAAPSKCTWKVVCRSLFKLCSFPQRLFKDLAWEQALYQEQGVQN